MMVATADWVLEQTNTVGVGSILLSGAVETFSSFADGVPAGEVWYSIQDSNGNRETGIGTFDGDAILARTTVQATLIGTVYNDVNPTPIYLSGNAVVSCVFSSSSYKDLLDKIVDASALIEVGADDVSYAPAGDPVTVATNVQNALIAHGVAIDENNTNLNARIDALTIDSNTYEIVERYFDYADFDLTPPHTVVTTDAILSTSTNNLDVYVSGVIQRYGTDFDIPSSTTIRIINKTLGENDYILAKIGVPTTVPDVDAADVIYTPEDTDYPSTSVKQRLDDLASSTGTDLIGYGDSTLSVALPQNIKQHGALSDGVTDAAPALRAAIAALGAAGGGQLFIPPGTYLMESLIGTAPFKRFADLISNIEIIGIPGKSIFKAAAGLSVSEQWNFLVGEFDADFENIKISGITFDYDGANNLTPVGSPYRPCTAVWVLANGTAGVSGENIEVSNCQFLDNPGSNSVSCVDAAPTGGINALSNVRINDNIFDGHGYVLNGLGDGVYNINNADHSCIYAQFESGEIKGNLFKQREPEPDVVSVGHSCIDHHSSDIVVRNNRSENVQTFIAHQSSGARLKRTIISLNILYGVERLYTAFEGTYNIEDVKISCNIIGLHASNRNMPVFDIANGIGSTLVFDVSIENNDLIVVSGGVSGKNAPFIKTTGIGNLLISGGRINGLPGQLILATPTKNITNLVVRDVNVYGWGAGNVSTSKDLINIDNTAGVTVNLSLRGGEALEGGTGSARDSIIRLKGTITSVVSEGVKIDTVLTYLSSVDSYSMTAADIKYTKSGVNYVYSAAKSGFANEITIGSRQSTDETTPSVSGLSLLRIGSTSAHTVTNFVDGVDGQIITLYATSSNVTIQHGATIINTSGSNIVMTIYSRIQYIYSSDASAWLQI